MSSGKLVKVGIIPSLIHTPKLVLWDEPFANLDPFSKSQLIELILKVRSKNQMAFIIGSHNIEEIYMLSDIFMVLSRGSVSALN